MQIISGAFRGRKLIIHKTDSTRPTRCTVRESVFNILDRHKIRNANVLDLFAGTGAYGAETISRGAKHVVFVDSDASAVDVVRKNVLPLLKSATSEILQDDWERVLKERLIGKKFDIVFLDPPYSTDLGEKAIDLLYEHGMINNGGVIVYETDKEYSQKVDRFSVKQKKYGRAYLYFLALKDN